MVAGIERALGWNGPEALGRGMAVGNVEDPWVGALLSTPRLLDLIRSRFMDPPLVRMFRDGTSVEADRYLRWIRVAAGQRGTILRTEGVRELLATGTTLIADTAELWDPVLEVTCRALQWWTRSRVTVNCFLTTRETAGFGWHWDDHEVLVVQLEGTKDWEVRAPTEVAPMDRPPGEEPPGKDAELWRGRLEPGSVLHLPRGHWHRASGTDPDGHSLHVTFGITVRTGVTWVEYLMHHARTSNILRGNLEPIGPGAMEEARRSELMQELDKVIKELPPDRLAADDARFARGSPTIEWFGASADVVVCSTDYPPLVTVDHAGVHVDAEGGRLTFPARAETGVRALLSGLPVDVASLSGTLGFDASSMAASFVAERLCSTVHDDVPTGFIEEMIRLDI